MPGLNAPCRRRSRRIFVLARWTASGKPKLLSIRIAVQSKFTEVPPGRSKEAAFIRHRGDVKRSGDFQEPWLKRHIGESPQPFDDIG
jgi:hypothetical protein